MALNQAAKLAGVDLALVRQLNPGFRRWASLPDEPYQLVLPKNKAATFKKALSLITDKDRVTWKHHQVLIGETLGGIFRCCDRKLSPGDPEKFRGRLSGLEC